MIVGEERAIWPITAAMWRSWPDKAVGFGRDLERQMEASQYIVPPGMSSSQQGII